jgi:hypothetical protein
MFQSVARTGSGLSSVRTWRYTCMGFGFEYMGYCNVMQFLTQHKKILTNIKEPITVNFRYMCKPHKRKIQSDNFVNP